MKNVLNVLNVLKCIGAVFLFSSMLIGCQPVDSSSSSSVSQIGLEDLNVSITVTNRHGTVCEVTNNGNEYFVTVNTDEILLSVKSKLGADIKIDGQKGRTKDFIFAAGEKEKKVAVIVSYQGNSQKHTVTIRLDKGLVKDIIIKDETDEKVTVYSGILGYSASVSTKKAAITVETEDTSAAVTIDNEAVKTKDIVFTDSETTKDLTVVVTHGKKKETHTVRIYYADPTATPKEAVLTSLTIKNADNENNSFNLNPEFNRHNKTYTVPVPATVNRIKVEALAEKGLTVDVEGGLDKTLSNGDNPIKITVKQTNNPLNMSTYNITVKKAKAGASSNAALKSLVFDAQWSGLAKPWKIAPAPFDKTIYEYMCTMDANCDEFYITAAAEEAAAVIKVVANGAAPVTLQAGRKTKFVPINKGINTFVVTITAPDAVTTQTYTIKAEKPEGSLILKTFKATGLEDFYAGKFDNYKKTGVFGSKNFDVSVSSDLEKTTISAEPEFPSSTTMKIKINGGKEEDFTGSKEINLTKEHPKNKGFIQIQIILKSSAAAGYDDTYTLWIQKVSSPLPNADADNSLTKLEVLYYGNGYIFYGIALNETFSPDTTDYSVTLPYGIQELRVKATPKSDKAIIDGWGGNINQFYAPFSTVEIPVIAENGSKKIYKVAVNMQDPATLTIDNPPGNAVIDLEKYSQGLTVSGRFTSPTVPVSEIWVGSSGLPIQMDNGGKWVKAVITDSTFQAVIPLASLKELSNGYRDIKIIALDTADRPITWARVPITVINNKNTASAVVTAKIDNKKNISIPSNASIQIIVYDKQFAQKGESVILASKSIDPIGNLIFPTSISLPDVKAGRECIVEVTVYERQLNKNTRIAFDTANVTAQLGLNNTCDIALKTFE